MVYFVFIVGELLCKITESITSNIKGSIGSREYETSDCYEVNILTIIKQVSAFNC